MADFNIPNGVRTETLENIEFEAGLILKTKYDKSTDTTAEAIKKKVLCATTGGIKVNIAQQKQVIAFDGVLDNTAGIERVIGWTASVQFSTKEVDADMVKRALGYASVASDKITLEQGIIPDTEYEDLYVLGKLGNGTWRQITIHKALNTTGLQETRNSKGETEIAFDLQAHYGIDTQDTAPVEIEYIEAQV